MVFLALQHSSIKLIYLLTRFLLNFSLSKNVFRNSFPLIFGLNSRQQYRGAYIYDKIPLASCSYASSSRLLKVLLESESKYICFPKPLQTCNWVNHLNLLHLSYLYNFYRCKINQRFVLIENGLIILIYFCIFTK